MNARRVCLDSSSVVEKSIKETGYGHRCVKCGAKLTDRDVMKIKVEDGPWETVPLTLCPNCFKEEMREHASTRRRREKA